MPFLRMCVVLCFLVSSALEAGAQDQPPPSAVPAPPTQTVLSEQVPATLMVWNRPLAVFRVPFGSRDPKQRADAASARIESALDSLNPDQVVYVLTQLGDDRGAMILGGAEPLFGLLEGDLPQDTARSLDTAGAQAVSRLQTVLRERAEQRRWPALVRSSAEALLATVAFVAVWLASWRALQWLLARLTRAATRRIKAAAIAGIDPRPLVFSALGWLIRLAGFAVRMAAAYIWLTFVLSRFAYSRPWGQTLGGFLIDTLTRMAAAVVDHLPNLITLAVILLITRVGTAAASAWFRAVERGDLPLSWLDPLAAKAARRLAVLAIWVFAITVAYPYVPGANTEAFKGVSVFVGLMVSLGSVGIVGQILGGLFVTFNRALRPGDVVKVGNVHGVVKDLGLVSVTLTTRAQEEVTIPNSVVVADAIRNFSRVPAGAVVLSTSVTIGYDAPWRQVRAMLLLAAARTDGVLQEPAPVVFETALSDFYVEYELVAHGAAAVPRPVLMSRLHEQILDAFNEQGVQIMSPHFEGQPDKPAIVERSKWFAAPAGKPAIGTDDR
jgi:small-conductance mechanosensitive channel